MSRPRSFDLDAVEEGLMNAFWRRGFTRTSLPDLTAASGLLRGSLYAAFGQKDAMFNMALERYLNWLRPAIVSDAPGIESLHYMLNAVVQITIDDPERRGCMLFNAIPEMHSLSETNRQAISRSLTDLRFFISGKLQEAKPSSSHKPDLEPLTALVFAAVVSIRVSGRAGLDSCFLQDIADGAITAVASAFQSKTSTETHP